MLLLAALGSLSGTGCLIAEAPDYGEPRRTTPVIDQDSVYPPPNFVVEVQPDEVEVKFSMTVRSEDAGEQIWAARIIDYEMGDPREIRTGPTQVPARAADQPKELNFDFKRDERIDKGCHTLTLLVMHETSYDLSNDQPLDDVSDGDVAAITWWLDVQTNDTTTPVPCPIFKPIP